MTPIRYAPLAFALAALAACNNAQEGSAPKVDGPVEAVAAPAGTTWSQRIEATEQGVRMGNPDAPIKIVEYASYTCPHCRDFSREGHEAIENDYVNSGKVNFEFRNMIRDPIDLTISLVAHCAGPDAFFAMSAQLFENQDAIIQQFMSHSEADRAAAAGAPPEQRFVRIAELVNLIEFAKQRGLPEEKVRTCLADLKKAESLAKVADDVVKKYPQFPGTPSFLLNGTLLDDTANWSKLQARLRDAGA